jgi:hypothetical protein
MESRTRAADSAVIDRPPIAASVITIHEVVVIVVTASLLKGVEIAGTVSTREIVDLLIVVIAGQCSSDEWTVATVVVENETPAVPVEAAATRVIRRIEAEAEVVIVALSQSTETRDHDVIRRSQQRDTPRADVSLIAVNDLRPPLHLLRAVVGDTQRITPINKRVR